MGNSEARQISEKQISSFKDILKLAIITTTDIEFHVSLKLLDPLPKQDSILKYCKDALVCYIGLLGKHPVVLVKCGMMGTHKRDGSHNTTSDVIHFLNVKAVIMSGIAFGKDSASQKIGDILISQTLIDYEPAKLKDQEHIPRGNNTSCSPILFSRFSQNDEWLNDSTQKTITIHKGALLSGEKLVNDAKAKHELFSRHSDGIGGEMEGIGVSSACDRKGVHWILVKAICDWADGSKNDNFQKEASQNSIEYIKYILTSAGILRDLGILSVDEIEFPDHISDNEFEYKEVHGDIITRMIYPRKKFDFERICDPKRKIYYEFASLNISPRCTLGYLFLGNPDRINIQQTAIHFCKNQLAQCHSLFVCSPRIISAKTGKDDFRLKNIEDKFSSCISSNKKTPIDVSYSYIDDLVWENSIQDIKEKVQYYIDEEKYFVDQKIVSNAIETPSLQYFDNIFENKEYAKPIIALLGGAGVGKTTLCDQLVRKLSSRDKKLPIYISSADIPTDIGDAEIKTISDLYSLINLDKHHVGNDLNSKSLEINICCGNVVVIIDGLDEIESKLKDRFHFDEFIESSLKLNESFQKCTIIITSRDYYKTKYENNVNIEMLMLYGFDNEMVQRYFQKRLSESLLKQANSILGNCSFAEKGYYQPILLTLICDLLEYGNDDIATVTLSNYLSSNISIDILIAKILEREIKRQSLSIDVDDVLDIFLEIIVNHNGTISKVDLDALLDVCIESAGQFNPAFYVNPLLKSHGNVFSIRYDILVQIIKSRYIIRCLKKNCMTKMLRDILIELYDGSSEILKDAYNNIDIQFEQICSSCRSIVAYCQKEVSDPANKSDIRSIENFRKIISGTLYLYFASPFAGSDRIHRTEKLVELLGKEISNIHIYNKFYTFDYSELTFKYCTFVDYRNLEKSKFPENRPVFFACIFKGDAMISSSKICGSIFAEDCAINGQLTRAIFNDKKEKNEIIKSIKDDIFIIFQTLFQGRIFVAKSENVLRTKQSSLRSGVALDYLLNVMVKQGIIKKENTYSSSSHYHYSVCEEYKSSVRHLITDNALDTKLAQFVHKLIQENFHIELEI